MQPWQPLLRLLQPKSIAYVCIGILLVMSIVFAHGRQPAPLHPPEFYAPFWPSVSPRAIRYQTTQREISLIAISWNLLGTILIVKFDLVTNLMRWTKRLKRAHSPITSQSLLELIDIAGSIIAFTLTMWFWNTPLGIASWYHERLSGFGVEPIRAWLHDNLMNELFGLLVIPLFWAGFSIVRRFEKSWWYLIWLLMIPVLFGVTVLQPVLIAPRFNSYTSLPGSTLKSKIIQLSKQSGAKNVDVYIEDTSIRTTHVNAYVTGIGPSARVVINDTALKQLDDDEILAMVGHELGHYREHHILVGFFTGVIGLGVFFWGLHCLLPARVPASTRTSINNNIDARLIPRIYLWIALFLLIQAPVESGISRILEHRADAYGLRLTHLHEATARLMKGFAERDFTDPDPPAFLHFWFGSHPTLHERIVFALDNRD